MTSRRTQKAAEAIREVVSMAILTDLKDPRVRDVTVTFVEVSPDMRQAKVHVSIMGDETRQNLSLRGLQNSAGFLQSKVAKRIDTRYTPRLTFVLDLGVKHSLEINRILQSVLPKDDEAEESAALDHDSQSDEVIASDDEAQSDESIASDHDSQSDDDVDAGDDDTEVSPLSDASDADRPSPSEDSL